MALEIGTVAATTGLTKEIYDNIDAYLSPPLESEPDVLPDARQSWRQLSHAIADAVVTYLVQNMEIVGVQTSGDVVVAVAGTSAGADPVAGHTHALDIADGDLTGVFDQVPGTGGVQ